MRIALALCALGGCAYQPGSFSYPPQDFAGQRVTVGCLDLAIERRTDLAIGPVLGYQFANRCDRPAEVDLASPPVIGRDREGREVRLWPYDPRGEIHAAALDGRAVGAEALAYPADRPMPQICVDAAMLAHQAPARWLCFGAAPRAVVGSAP